MILSDGIALFNHFSNIYQKLKRFFFIYFFDRLYSFNSINRYLMIFEKQSYDFCENIHNINFAKWTNLVMKTFFWKNIF